jgi:hypothetical protein
MSSPSFIYVVHGETNESSVGRILTAIPAPSVSEIDPVVPVYPGPLLALTVREMFSPNHSIEKIFVDTWSRIGSETADPSNPGVNGADPADSGAKRTVMAEVAAVLLDRDHEQFVNLTPCRIPALTTDSHACTVVDMASGDVNGDGYADLVALVRVVGDTGVPLGNLFVWRGPFVGATPPRYAPTPLLSGDEQTIIEGGENVMVVGGRDSLSGTIVIGFPDFVESQGEGGAVLLVRHTNFGHANNVTQIVRANEGSFRFGASVVACDVDGDGFQDLLVGVRDPAISEGAVNVYPGAGDGTLDGRFVTLTAPATAVSFGRLIACGDLDGDEFDDLVVVWKEGQNRVVDVFERNLTNPSDPFYKLWTGGGAVVSEWGADVAVLDGVGLLVGAPGGESAPGSTSWYGGNWSAPSLTYLLPYQKHARAGATVVGGLPVPGGRGFVAVAAPEYVVASNRIPPPSTGAVYMYDLGLGGSPGTDSVATNSSTTAPATVTASNTSNTTVTSTSALLTSAALLEVEEGGASSGLDVPVAVGLGVACVALFFALLLGGLVWLKRRRAAAGTELLVSTTSSTVPHKSRRVTRGSSKSRLDRTESRSTTRTRRSRAPTSSQAGPPITAYGETSLAQPVDASQYAQTSLYPAPLDGAARVEYESVPVRPPM